MSRIQSHILPTYWFFTCTPGAYVDLSTPETFFFLPDRNLVVELYKVFSTKKSANCSVRSERQESRDNQTATIHRAHPHANR